MPASPLFTLGILLSFHVIGVFGFRETKRTRRHSLQYNSSVQAYAPHVDPPVKPSSGQEKLSNSVPVSSDEETVEPNHDEVKAKSKSQRLSDPLTAGIRVAMACNLIYLVCFMMLLTYFTNHRKKRVRLLTYLMLSMTIGTCAALVWDSGSRQIFVRILFVATLGGDAFKSVSGLFMRAFVAFLFCSFYVFLISRLCFKFKDQPYALYVCKELLGNIAGSSCFDMFGLTQRAIGKLVRSGSQSVSQESTAVIVQLTLLYVLTPVVSMTFCYLMLRLSAVYRAQLESTIVPDGAITTTPDEAHSDQHTIDEAAVEQSVTNLDEESPGLEEKPWLVAVREAEIDVCGIANGYIIRALIIFVTQQRVPTVMGELKLSTSIGQASLMGLASFSAIVVLASVCHISRDWASLSDHMEFFMGLTTYIASWCNLTFFWWLIAKYISSNIHNQVMLPFLLTPAAIGGLALLEKLVEHGFLSLRFTIRLVCCLGLLTACTWDSGFQYSVADTIENAHLAAEDLPWWLLELGRAFIFFAVLALVLPAWYWYVVPTAVLEIPLDEGQKKQRILTKVLAVHRFSSILVPHDQKDPSQETSSSKVS